MLNVVFYVRTRLSSQLAAAILLAGCLTPQSAQSLTIAAQLTDLADLTPGTDLWHADYLLSSGSFLSDQGFTIYFDPSLYSDLSGPTGAVSPDWDLLIVQPDTALPAPGFFDGLALVDGASTGLPFGIDFTWLGPSDPGSQDFEVYDLNGGFFQIVESGRTTVPTAGVPEGGGLFWMFGLTMGLALFVYGKSARAPAATGCSEPSI